MANQSDGAGGWIVGLFVFWLIYQAAIGAWYSKVRYAAQYGVDYSHVYKDKKPHDCEWLAAPLGDKNCHYDAEARKDSVMTSTDRTTGRPIVSYDEGKSWSWNDGDYPAKAESNVYVSWQKVED
jgi:hypothetical protein